MSTSAAVTTPRSKVPVDAMDYETPTSARRGAKDWYRQAAKYFGVVKYTAPATYRWLITPNQPHVLVLRVFATNEAKLVVGGIDFGTRSGVVQFLLEILEIEGVVDVVQPFPNLRIFLFSITTTIAQLEESGVRPGVLKLGQGLGFDIRALPPLQEHVVPFVVEGVLGGIDEEKLVEQLKGIPGVVGVRDMTPLKDSRGIRDGKVKGYLTYDNKEGSYGDDARRYLTAWRRGHFKYPISIGGVEYVVTSLVPCFVCSSSDHHRHDCTIPAVVKKSPLLELPGQSKPAAKLKSKKSAPVPEPTASTSSGRKERKRSRADSGDDDDNAPTPPPAKKPKRKGKVQS